MPSPARDPDRRGHLVATAYGLFKRGGFHATGIDRIIAEAGVAKMTLYRHFPTKDALIAAVLEQRARRFARRLDRMEQIAATPEAAIAALFDWYGRWFAQADFHGCLFQHALAEYGAPGHPVHEAAAQQKRDLRRRLQRLLEVDHPPERAAHLAAALLMLIEGATLLARTGDGAAIAAARAAAGELLAAPVAS
ncbi:MAG: TetR family transcriptional regulator [Xanthobacteraceae bacterium]